ncbi:hypothetical protein BDP55DRAFT_392361 [Colletotrichum godetiae]|uniref:Uncharacterized protein n=1 Tax=Colletotrichum godetiae TaxID=1209918 RepID=A0AAJ0ACY4_9PEZI|nr:uncharacterized protein BDP55DRAFT_392361 [Colletotrichum godetiae]KAK1658630.1 hypothetical protein BDP55DRAFT_392361 [Colletotrichum godetiae]
MIHLDCCCRQYCCLHLLTIYVCASVALSSKKVGNPRAQQSGSSLFLPIVPACLPPIYGMVIGTFPYHGHGTYPSELTKVRNTCSSMLRNGCTRYIAHPPQLLSGGFSPALVHRRTYISSHTPCARAHTHTVSHSSPP